MSLALTRENYFWHKVHSLTGIVPVGFYMVQHLTLNSFTIAGPDKFNGVIDFFEGLPKHLLLVLEVCVIWLPLLFHAVYGLFIIGRAKPNFIGTKYGWSQNRMYWLQRVSGGFIFLFLCYHVFTTTVTKYVTGNADMLKYAAWHDRLTANGYIVFALYLVGIVASTYHLSYGIWNFCIRWGITVSDQAQIRIQKFALGVFVLLTFLGWGALGGFLLHDGGNVAPSADASTATAL